MSLSLEAKRARVIKLSHGRSVGLSSALRKNGGSDLDAVWHHRSNVARDQAGNGIWGSVHEKGYFWGRIWGTPLYPMNTIYGVGVQQCLNRRSCGLRWCMRWAEALPYQMGIHVVQGRAGFGGFCSLFSQSEMPLGRRR